MRPECLHVRLTRCFSGYLLVGVLFSVDVWYPKIDSHRALGNQNIFSDLLTFLAQGLDVIFFVPYWTEQGNAFDAFTGRTRRLAEKPVEELPSYVFLGRLDAALWRERMETLLWKRRRATWEDTKNRILVETGTEQSFWSPYSIEIPFFIGLLINVNFVRDKYTL